MAGKSEYPRHIFHEPTVTSSAAQPFLSAVAIDVSDRSSSDDDLYPPISYLHGRRPLRDLPPLLLFLLFAFATYVIGLVAVARRNPDAPVAASFFYDRNLSSCVLLSPVSFPSDPLSFILSPSSSTSPPSPFLKVVVGTLVVTLLLSGPIVLGLLWLLRHYAGQFVHIAVPFFVLTPAFLNVYWFVACQVAENCRRAFPMAYRVLVFIFVFVLIAVVLWIIVVNWHCVRLTVRILTVASAALTANLDLFVVLPAMSIGLLAYLVPIVLFLVYSTWNGSVIPKEVEGAGGKYHKCMWKQERWVPAYFALAVVTMLWSATTMLEAKLYATSGTIAQWYFHKEAFKPTKGIRRSLRNAFGPSFGTVCLSGMVMAPVCIARAVLDCVEGKKRESGFVNLILKCCADFLLASFDFLNKFTINFSAITGEGYCSAAKMTYELLKRNLLSTAFVETVTPRMMVGIISVISVLYAIAVCAILKAFNGSLSKQMYLVAALAWLLLMVVLGYFVHVLNNVIDAIYICFAIDRDKGEICKQQVHEVYLLLPGGSRKNHESAIDRSSRIILY